MGKFDINMFRKQFRLAGAGVGLQVLGGFFLFAAMLGTMKEVNHHIRQLLIQKLSETE